MKRIILLILVLGVVLAGAAYAYRDTLTLMAMRASLKPATPFDETIPPEAPDYTLDAHWAALPTKEDGADRTPAGVTDGQADAKVDVFFVHPTTFIENTGWNAPMGHEGADDYIRNAVLPGQASAFNGAGRIYAPHYRQAQFYSFLALAEGGNEALELAYGDVEAAFDHFLNTHSEGRPFILAGHSQGALHVRYLMERRIAGTPLEDRLVAAYPVGWHIPKMLVENTMPSIPVCSSAEETGCFVTWNTVGEGYEAPYPMENMVCVNPLSWSISGETVAAEANLGGFSISGPELYPGAADATCKDGVLHITGIDSEPLAATPMRLGPGNYHVLDYSLYWSNVRENATARVQAYLAGSRD